MSNARAMDSRWRSPPDSERPRSPTLASKPSTLYSINRAPARGPLPSRYLLVGRVGFANTQVFRKGAIEQQRFLEHHADVVSKRANLDIAHIYSVDPDTSGLRIEGAMQQHKSGRFAGTGRADKGHRLPREGGKAQARNCWACAIVGNETSVKLYSTD